MRIPNISKLSERIGINRHTLLAYLHYLHEAKLILSFPMDMSLNIQKRVIFLSMGSIPSRSAEKTRHERKSKPLLMHISRRTILSTGTIERFRSGCLGFCIEFWSGWTGYSSTGWHDEDWIDGIFLWQKKEKKEAARVGRADEVWGSLDLARLDRKGRYRRSFTKIYIYV